MKKLIFVLFAVGFTTPLISLADVSVPLQAGGFEVTATGLYLQPSDASLNYHGSQLFTSFFDSIYLVPQLGAVQKIDPGYDWGYGLSVGYLFPNTGNDIQANWTHLDTHTFNGPSPNVTGHFDDGIGDVYSATITDNGSVAYTLNNVDLDLGQYINVGSRLTSRLYAGLRYSDLDRDFDTQADYTRLAQQTNIVEVSNIAVNEDSTFEGVGPLMGVQGQYALGNGFGIDANADGAVLVGSARTNATLSGVATVATQGQAPSISQAFSQKIPVNQTRIVSELDGQLGLDYDHKFNDIDFTVAAGYQASEYFNVFDRISSDAATALVLNPFPAERSFNPLATNDSTSNVGFNGPFVSLTVKA